MDEKFVELLFIQNSVLSYAVRALLRNHPDLGAVRRAFDLEFDQANANLVAQGESPAAFAAARQFADGLFP